LATSHLIPHAKEKFMPQIVCLQPGVDRKLFPDLTLGVAAGRVEAAIWEVPEPTNSWHPPTRVTLLVPVQPQTCGAQSGLKNALCASQSSRANRNMEGHDFHVTAAFGYLPQTMLAHQPGQMLQLSRAELHAPLTMITDTPVVVLFCLGSALLKCCFSLPVTSACILFSWEASSYRREKNPTQ
jgi:hypothetical protein